MNPLSLLTKGHTFGGVNDRRGAYKVLPGYVLPNFAAPKGPSFAATPPPGEPLQTALFEQPPPAVAAAVPPKRADAVPTAPKAMASPANERPLSPGVWRRVARWSEEFLWWRKGPVKLAPSVQTELALAKVTVMRNDLNEDDLVVVTVEKKPRLQVQSENIEVK
jgi:hypothetical protein